MKSLLYWIVGWITKIHNYILRLNDAFEYNFTDKELHFLVIGILGMAFIFAIYPIFKWLANRGHIMTITFIYAFTLIIVITFAIEIGQKVTNTGNMEFADIVMGVFGFVLMYAVFAVVRQICKAIAKLCRRLYKPQTADRTDEEDGETAMQEEVIEPQKELTLEELLTREALKDNED